MALIIFLTGVFVISLSGAMMPGPVLAVLISKSHKNKYAGTLVTLGHILVELPLILLIWFGFGYFFKFNLIKILVSGIGGILIIKMGVDIFKARNNFNIPDIDKSQSNKGIIFGGLIGSLNPYFFIWWATLGSALIFKSLSFGILGLVLFTAVHFGVDLLWYQGVNLLVFKSHRFWGEKTHKTVFMICSAVLILFGLYFIGSIFKFIH
ncbi:MAG TPA: LysE family transporter [Elusimicrobiales bacterium]|nr:LysE family transporter [Elusimicrobiales bacterium]